MYEFIVQAHESGRKLSSLLMQGHGLSRRLLRRMITTDGVRLNGEVALLSTIVQAGDRVELTFPAETSTVAPEPMKLEICYEDADVLVINKPAGCLTHPSARQKTGSLLAGVAHYLAPQGLVPHSVHRLDKYTSGAILFAKHAHAHHLLDAALRAQQVHRQYVALVYAEQALPLNTWTTLTDYIAQNAEQPSRRVIGDATNGQKAITHMQPLARIDDLYVCRFRLETGRTHQIRLQMAARGMPLVGDRDYTFAFCGRAETAAARYYERVLPHQALHAYRLEWRVKTAPAAMCVYAAPTRELEELWSLLGGDTLLHDMLQNRA